MKNRIPIPKILRKKDEGNTPDPIMDILYPDEKEEFKTKFELQLRCCCHEFMIENGKISYLDGCQIANYIDLLFLKLIKHTPKEIKGAYTLTLVLIAPDVQTKKKLLKDVFSILGGSVAIVAIITGIGLALGWTQTMISFVIAVFTAKSFLGPLVWIASGATLAVLIGYFYFTNTDEAVAVRFERALTAGLDKAIDSSWNQYAKKIHEYLNKGKSMEEIIQDTEAEPEK